METTPISVSVIIPTHNRSDLLSRALSSVLAQTYQPEEILVIDDGSTEDIASRVDALAQGRARVIRRDIQGGAAAARNTGCRAARSKYIAFLDSDDEWLPNKLEIQVSSLEQSVEIDLSCTAFEIVRPDGRLETRKFRTHKATRGELAFGCGLSPGSSLVLRREFFNRVGPFDESMARFEDWDWLLRAANFSAIGLVNQILCRVYAGARPPEDLVHRSVLQIREKHAQSYKRMGLGPSLKFRAGLLHERAVAAFCAGRFIPAATMLIFSAILYPVRPRDLYPRIWRSW